MRFWNHPELPDHVVLRLDGASEVSEMERSWRYMPSSVTNNAVWLTATHLIMPRSFVASGGVPPATTTIPSLVEAHRQYWEHMIPQNTTLPNMDDVVELVMKLSGKESKIVKKVLCRGIA